MFQAVFGSSQLTLSSGLFFTYRDQTFRHVVSSCEEERILLFFNNRISFFLAKRYNTFKVASSKFQRYLQRNNGFNEATSSRFQQVSIQRTPHDGTTPPPHPPTPPSVNNNDTCNVTTSSTKRHPQGFNKSQSNALHMTLLPHPPPPISIP